MDGVGAYDDWQDTVSELRRWFEQQQEEAARAKAEALAELTAYARTAGAPPELREAQERIDLGLLSWDAVLAGEGGAASRLIDARLAELAPLAEAIRDGATPEEAAAELAKEARR
ncbi:hypothetical protein Val02_14680 [Virgisporangium aliadipatigenens]|uniref:Uncharacterized protein n=1 Tax=Virgisporangium aliadipatigenens TaxID=741659 RepID=A0A8J3YHK9_9ACTN|nr:hypothetical protein [Virgisporangium aliadipatigenens]GIJ44582.1 hypothetical protein Val02_14680 [Virgisporangium aliadipatigenens]